jgi:hypothetical protein
VSTSWSQLVLAALAVVFAAAAGSLLSSGTTSLTFFIGIALAVGAAMVCGGAAAVQVFRAQMAARAPADTEELTIDLADGVPAASRASLKALRPLVSFVAACSVTLALAIVVAGWSDARSVTPSALPMVAEAVAEQPVPVAVPEVTTQPVEAAPVAVPATVLRAPVNPSLARRECLAQIESAHLFLGLAREAKGAGAYTRLSNTQIKRYQAARPVDGLTLQRIALRMWEQRDAPDRDGRWWSSQYASCEQARVAGAAYTVRG